MLRRSVSCILKERYSNERDSWHNSQWCNKFQQISNNTYSENSIRERRFNSQRMFWLWLMITIPPNPMTTWNKADTAMAPESSLILICHSSVRFSGDIWFKISGSGHFHCGKFSIANVGTKKDIVPPWTSGNLWQRIEKIRNIVSITYWSMQILEYWFGQKLNCTISYQQLLVNRDVFASIVIKL